MAIRAASIWRLVIHAGSRACRPYSPKCTVVPPLARPFSLPFCTLRCLTRLGINMSMAPFPAGLLLRENLAAVNPHLHADAAIGGVRFDEAVVDVGAQRMQRHRAFHVAFRAGDFRAAQASAHHRADALGAG